MAGALYWQARRPDPKHFGMGDSDGYFTLGRALAEGQPYEYGPHGWQIFRARAIRCCWPPCSGSLVNTRSLPRTWKTPCWAHSVWRQSGGSRQWFGARAALLAAAMAAFYPESIASSAMILSDTPFCALMLLQLGLWTAAWKAWEEKGTAPFFPCPALGAKCRIRRRQGDPGPAQLAAVHSLGGHGRRCWAAGAWPAPSVRDGGRRSSAWPCCCRWPW